MARLATRGWLGWIATLAMFASALHGCAELGEEDVTRGAPEVSAYGVIRGALSTSALLSANGTYGASCLGRANTNWSVALSAGAALDYTALAVPKTNTSCVLSLVALRTGTGASNLYTATSPIVLSTTYAAASTSFSVSGTRFAANAELSAIDFTSNFVLTVLVADNASVTSTSTAAFLYDAQINHDNALSYWRLNDATTASDDFTDTAGTTLQLHLGAVGATWTKNTAASATDAVITDANRLRVGVAQTAVYTASGTPASADYCVQADVYPKTVLTSDQAGVVGRASSTAKTYYYAGVVSVANTGCFCCGCSPVTSQWELWKYVSGTGTRLGYSAVTLAAGTTYSLKLSMKGTSIVLSVNGTDCVSVTDSAISATGNAGVLLGVTGGSVPSNTAGLHLDNLRVQPTALDSRGTNHGTYSGGVTLGATGALTTSNKAVTFGGADGYVEVSRQISDDFSIEFWFKSSQGLGANTVTNWYSAAGMVDASSASSGSDFGVSLRSDGKVLAGVGLYTPVNYITCFFYPGCYSSTTIVSSGATVYNNGAWHHAVFTRTKSSGALVLYLDGQSAGTATGTTSSLTDVSFVDFGRLQTGSLYLSGTLDEIAVYNTVLSASTVLTHYQDGLR